MLGRIDLSPTPNIIGKNTNDGLRSGFHYGFLGQVEGIIRGMERELGQETKVIATGGLATLVAGDSELVDRIHSDLLLEGLRILYHRILESRKDENI